MNDNIFKNFFSISKLTSKKDSEYENYNELKIGNRKLIKKIKNEEQVNSFLIDYRYNLKFTILKSNRDDLIMESQELSLPHANSLRRILLGEVNTFAIEKVFFYSNSSILNDENIAHRLGLIPILVNSEYLTELKNNCNFNAGKIILDFRIKNPQESFEKMSVYSKSLKLKNYGLFYSLNKNFPINPVFRDILILKLNPGQKIKCECHCVIDSGFKHAKFSPVGTAFYRITPKVKIVGEILGNLAEKLYEICPVKIFSIKETFNGFTKNLKISYPQFCTLCKECLRYKTGKPKEIRISRVKNKLTFMIESTGVLSPETLFHRAVSLLVGKCNNSLSILFKSYGC